MSVEELTRIAGFRPTETLIKGTRHTDRSSPAPANAIFLSTESLVREKDLNAHIRELGSRLPKGVFSSKFGNEEVTIYLTIYWWTTEEVGFYLDTESFDVLSKIGVPAYFNFLIDPSPINPTVETE
ncbi:DUF4279 domain-containing protein [Rhizobium sp. MHM7A]|uniref:DUF4279 domain-containing protein n=1 Tax=Rhizobium sp. MHM7A TaxID=2583233 RepID=UPI0011075763|nr:DUF4279 domain-containing protein [Rhizobium sp. MHM7A]TLX17155.1 DUF4279 domain-containing protein [Rhizobium sp. MHM7A]